MRLSSSSIHHFVSEISNKAYKDLNNLNFYPDLEKENKRKKKDIIHKKAEEYIDTVKGFTNKKTRI